MIFEHQAVQIPLAQLVPQLDAASAEGWELAGIGPLGAQKNSRLEGAGPPTPVLMCVLRREKVHPLPPLEGVACLDVSNPSTSEVQTS